MREKQTVGWRLQRFHTQNKTSLHMCELSYCCVIVNWQEGHGAQLCNVSLSCLLTLTLTGYNRVGFNCVCIF